MLVSNALIAAPAAISDCSDPIVADTKLQADLVCAADVDGLLINAHGVTVNLNGFTITGSGMSSGVFNVGFHGVTIKNGAITGFQDGVRADGVSDIVIKDLVLSNQSASSIVIVNSADLKIARVFISQPKYGGSNPATEAIRLANVHDAKVKDVIVDGGYFGLLSVGETGASTEIVAKRNVFANTTHGIFLNNTRDSRIIDNRVFDNAGIGIGLVEGSVDNKIKMNVVTGNNEDDLFHDETSSPNKWTNNTCGSSGGDDIDCP
jgi:parallel beta-helix repeat protein